MPFLRSWTWFTPWLVNFHHGLSRAVSCSFYAVIFTRSRSCRLCWDRIWEPDCAVTRAQIIGTDTRLIWDAEYATPSSLEVNFRVSNLESRLILCPCNVRTTLPPPHHANTKGKQVLEAGNTWGTRTSWGKYLRDKNFMGDRGHFLWLAPHWGSLEDCLACIGYRKLRRVILGPKSILLCTA